jgi:type II secretory pathway pseudopilin PulG
MVRGDRRRHGTVLLEVMIATALVGLAAAVIVASIISGEESAERARRADDASREASGFLEVVTLWPREELDQRLGRRRQGEWDLYIDRITPGLYAIELDAAAGRPLLRTTVYRPVHAAGGP